MEHRRVEAKKARGDLTRLLNPRSIAVVGGGVWCRSVVDQAQRFGYAGSIEVVHPHADQVGNIRAKARLADLEQVPDAVFLGINRTATVPAVAELSKMGAGGVVCFASGFAEALAEDGESGQMQEELVAAAGSMPVLGPNCYGFINALDGALLWPDQHGCSPVTRGVAILTQSSNIAINFTMQQRGLPIAYMVTCGNMAQTSQAQIAQSLLDDQRVTAIGLHVEGFGDPLEWHALAVAAQTRGVPMVVLKTGASEQASQAAVSHTASLAGSDAGASALLAYLGVPRVKGVPEFLETLMLLHCTGGLSNSAVSSISCSGGEASLSADVAMEFDVTLPALSAQQRAGLSDALGPMVALANPLDYHTYIWGDVAKMAAAWAPMAAEHIGVVLVIVDYPWTDAAAWECATEAVVALQRKSPVPVALVATMQELLPPELAATLREAGVVPLHGLREAFAAIEAASHLGKARPVAPLATGPLPHGQMMSEARAKRLLVEFGMTVPEGVFGHLEHIKTAARALSEPLVLKAQGLAHKSETGGVRLNLTLADLVQAAAEMTAEEFLVEEMVSGAIAELLIGIVRDEAHGFVLTLGAGGTLTELLQDRVSLLLPVTRADVLQGLQTLRCWPVLEGYRGAPGADLEAIADAVLALQDFAMAHSETLCEVEINPLICKTDRVVAADALIVRAAQIPTEGDGNGADKDAPERAHS